MPEERSSARRASLSDSVLELRSGAGSGSVLPSRSMVGEEPPRHGRHHSAPLSAPPAAPASCR